MPVVTIDNLTADRINIAGVGRALVPHERDRQETFVNIPNTTALDLADFASKGVISYSVSQDPNIPDDLEALKDFGDLAYTDRDELSELPDLGEEGEVLTVEGGEWKPKPAAGGGGSGTVVVAAERITGTQALGSSSTTGLIFNDASVNVGGIYDTSTGVFVPTSTGQYLIHTRWSLFTAYSHQIHLQKDDGGFSTVETIAYRNTNYGVNATAVVLLEAGSSYRLAFQSHSGAGSSLAVGAKFKLSAL